MSSRSIVTGICVLLAGTALACGDFVSATRAGGPSEPAPERPEGWESLEDEGSATRLYYQFVDPRGQVRFVETLEDVPEALRAGVGFVKLDVAPPLSPGDAARVRQERRERSASTRIAAAAPGSGIVLYSAEWCGAPAGARFR
jgi:hypothetical protein